MSRTREEIAAFMTANLELASPPEFPELRLYAARPDSRLRRLVGEEAPAPYWAYCWAGGLALARFLREHPETVEGRRVLDLGSGSGLVAIAAARCGAHYVLAAELDPNAVVALEFNAAANDVRLDIIARDITTGAVPAVDLVLVGDVFYAPDVAARVRGFLDRCVGAGVDVLVGDPGRKDLPLPRLRLLADYPIVDFGQSDGRGYVYVYGRA